MTNDVRNEPLVGRHGFLWLREIKLPCKAFLSFHGLGELCLVVDNLSFGGRHCFVYDVFL